MPLSPRAHGLEWTGGGGGVAVSPGVPMFLGVPVSPGLPVPLPPLGAESPGLGTTPSSGCTQLSLPKRKFFLLLQNNYVEELKKLRQTACPFVPVDVNNTRNTIILWAIIICNTSRNCSGSFNYVCAFSFSPCYLSGSSGLGEGSQHRSRFSKAPLFSLRRY